MVRRRGEISSHATRDLQLAAELVMLLAAGSAR